MTKKIESLDTKDISTTRTGRRSAMWIIGAAVTAVATQACATGCTDRDSGVFRDPANAGIHCRATGTGCPSGCTDRDPNDPSSRGCHC